MKVIVKEPGKGPSIRFIGNRLNLLQTIVGGNIEAVTLFEDFCIICNEDGRGLRLKHNCEILGVDFVGTIIGVGVKGDEFDSIPQRMTLDVFKEMITG